MTDALTTATGRTSLAEIKNMELFVKVLSKAMHIICKSDETPSDAAETVLETLVEILDNLADYGNECIVRACTCASKMANHYQS